MNKSISFDLDGILYPWVGFAFEYALENHYISNGETVENFILHEELHTSIFWDNLVRIPMLYYKSPMKKEYKILLDKFASSGWTIYYLTARPLEIFCVTYSWLFNAQVPFLENLNFTSKKSSAIRFNNIAYHIDDRSHCIEDVKNFVTKSFLVNTFYNKDYKEPSNCVRINNILEVEKELL
jgi:uncharacterized HAD superfamily protein